MLLFTSAYKMQRFTAEEMISDPAPPPAVATFTQIEDGGVPAEKPSRASVWFDNNKVSRVPLIALEPDLYRVKDQAWALFSMIRPDEYKSMYHKNKQYQGYLIKFRGVFSTREEAEAHIKKLMQIDRHFDVHLVPAFTWSGIDDDCVEDRAYADEMVGSILKGYFENENARMSGIRDRIANTENTEGCGLRSDEAMSFFNGCQPTGDDDMSALELPEPSRRPGMPISMSLDDLAAGMDITPGGRARGGLQIGRDAAESVVSVALLD